MMGYRPAVSLTLPLLLLTSTLVSWCLCGELAVIGRGDCPTTPTQGNFNATKYLGTWYEYERFGNLFQPLVQCGRAIYGDLGNHSISVTNAGTRKIRVLGFTVDESPVLIKGSASVVDLSSPAELRVTFSEFDQTSTAPNYFVVETDYTGYAVVYSCDRLPGDFFNLQLAWVLTRSPGVAPGNLAAIKARLSSAGVPVEQFRAVEQTDCNFNIA